MQTRTMRRNLWWTTIGMLSLILGAPGCAPVETTPTARELTPPVAQQATPTDLPEYWPTVGWRTQEILNGEGEDVFADLGLHIEAELPFMNSILVINDGYIVYEAYFNHYRAEDLQHLQSVSKSVTSSLVGIALDRGDIPSLDVTVGDVLPEYFAANPDWDTADITLRDALMMRSGLSSDVLNLTGEFSSQREYTEYVQSSLDTDLVGSVLSNELAYEPGSAWRYNTSDTQIIAGMFQRLTGQSLADYAEAHLFAPLNISRFSWAEDASGVTLGGVLLNLSPGDLAKFGYLYLKDGYWENGPVVPAEWVRLSTQSQPEGINTDSGEVEPIRWYGYQWWVWEPGSFGLPSGAYQALGYGGQMVLVLPDIDTVIVTTSNSLVTPETSNLQQKAIVALVEDRVLPALLNAVRPPGDQ